MALLDEHECRRRFAEAQRAVLSTVHPERGVDAVPVTIALAGATIWTPVDTVKPKRSTRLTRLANIAAEPRVSLLVDHWDEDWSRLWWVRVHGLARLASADELPAARAALAARYAQYREPGAITAVVRVDDLRWSGWSAEP